jgi:2-polyprenyl-3-methyl-5-hydroxy-6-metoxy-1,4-benzoquinol methylase
MQFVRIADKKRVDFICREILQHVPRGSQVLDVGCGNGIISKAVAELGYEVDAIDASEKTICTARLVNPHPHLTYKIVPAGELQAQPGKYSAIICSEVLEHLFQPEQLLRILSVSLTSDGIMLVTVPNGRGPREMLVTKPVQYLQQSDNLLWRMVVQAKKVMGYSGRTIQSSAEDLFHIQFFTISKLKKLASQHGFRIVRIKPSNFVEQVFPFSLFARKSTMLQKLDCRVAEALPLHLTSGFMMVWKKL